MHTWSTCRHQTPKRSYKVKNVYPSIVCPGRHDTRLLGHGTNAIYPAVVLAINVFQNGIFVQKIIVFIFFIRIYKVIEKRWREM